VLTEQNSPGIYRTPLVINDWLQQNTVHHNTYCRYYCVIIMCVVVQQCRYSVESC